MCPCAELLGELGGRGERGVGSGNSSSHSPVGTRKDLRAVLGVAPMMIGTDEGPASALGGPERSLPLAVRIRARREARKPALSASSGDVERPREPVGVACHHGVLDEANGLCPVLAGPEPEPEPDALGCPCERLLSSDNPKVPTRGSSLSCPTLLILPGTSSPCPAELPDLGLPTSNRLLLYPCADDDPPPCPSSDAMLSISACVSILPPRVGATAAAAGGMVRAGGSSSPKSVRPRSVALRRPAVAAVMVPNSDMSGCEPDGPKEACAAASVALRP